MKPKDLKIGSIYQLQKNKLDEDFEDFDIYFRLHQIIKSQDQNIKPTLYCFKPIGGFVNNKKISKEEIDEAIDFTISADNLFIFKNYENPITVIDDIYEE